MVVTLDKIVESLKKLPADKLPVVYDFVSYLAGVTSDNSTQVGQPTAVIVPVEEYEKLKARERSRKAFHEFSRALGKAVEEQGLSEEEFLKEVEETKREVFAERYGNLSR